MQKFEKSIAHNSGRPNKSSRNSFSEESDDFELDDLCYNSKLKVKCMCPKCGRHHVMAFHWSGRGTPRKFCQSCKDGPIG